MAIRKLKGNENKSQNRMVEEEKEKRTEMKKEEE
jgi:hypothetical protein